MKIGGCSFAFGARTLPQAADLLLGFGFEVFDLGVCSNENAQVDPHAAAARPRHWANYVSGIVGPRALELVECFVLDFGQPINHPDAQIRDTTRRLFPGLLEFVRLVGGRSVMLIPGVVHPELGRDRSFELAVAELTILSRMASEHGILLNIEACEPSVAERPEDAGRLCSEVPGLGLTLDYSHFIDPGYSQEEVETLHPYARHFHIRQAAAGKRVERVDQGSIDFQRLVKRLQQDNYQGVLAVEYVDCPQTDECGVDVMTETPKMKAELERILNV